MLRTTLSTAICLTVTTFFQLSPLASGTLSAQVTRSGLVSNDGLGRIGLERSWFTQIRMNRSRDELISLTQHVRFDDEFEVEMTVGRNYIFNEWDRGSDGQPIGKKEARLRAEEKMILLKEDGLNPKFVERKIPTVTLFAQTKRGIIQAINAESGRTLWIRDIGRGRSPSTAVGANDAFVAVTNGTTLYVLDRNSGNIIWKQRVGGVPVGGPMLTAIRVYVPLRSGRVEAYRLDQGSKTPWSYQSIGKLTTQPVASSRSISWPTERGHFYVISSGVDPTIKYRLEARDEIVAPATYSGGTFFVAGQDGYVYAIEELRGDKIWQFSTGIPIAEQPVAIGTSVFAFPRRGGVFCLDTKTGGKKWWAPRAQRFLAASKTRLYALDVGGRLLVLDIKSGGMIDRLDTNQLTFSMVNQQTDRIYIGTNEGLIQCLRESGAKKPTLHAATPAMGKPKTDEQSDDARDVPDGDVPDADIPDTDLPNIDPGDGESSDDDSLDGLGIE